MILAQDLLRVKTRALRLKVWFRVLSRTERAIMDLTLKCVERIRSRILEETITNILDKLIMVLEQGFLTRAEKIGSRIAEKLCEIAEKWGNDGAFAWKTDAKFIRFLGTSSLNQ